MARLVKIADTNEVAPGNSSRRDRRQKHRPVQRGRHLLRHRQHFHSRGRAVDEGTLTGDVVACPWHNAKFNVTTGAVLGPPARPGGT